MSVPRRTARRVTALLATLICVLSVGTATASASHSTADVCFRHSNGSPYTYTVYAQKFTGSGWVNIASDSGTVNGCNRWTVRSGQRIRFQAFYRVGRTYFQGTSGSTWIRSGYQYNYGTTYVYMYGY